MRISFNRPPFVGKETEYIKEAVEKNGMICGDVSIYQKMFPVDEGKVSDKKRIADNFLYPCTGDGSVSGGYSAGR